jgi:hypothetical protein
MLRSLATFPLLTGYRGAEPRGKRGADPGCD